MINIFKHKTPLTKSEKFLLKVLLYTISLMILLSILTPFFYFKNSEEQTCKIEVNSKIVQVGISSITHFNLHLTLENGKEFYFNIPNNYIIEGRTPEQEFLRKAKVGDMFIKQGNTSSFVTVSKDTSIWTMSCPLDIYNK